MEEIEKLLTGHQRQIATRAGSPAAQGAATQARPHEQAKPKRRGNTDEAPAARQPARPERCGQRRRGPGGNSRPHQTTDPDADLEEAHSAGPMTRRRNTQRAQPAHKKAPDADLAEARGAGRPR
jgi:hypothetical protein